MKRIRPCPHIYIFDLLGLGNMGLKHGKILPAETDAIVCFGN